MGILVQARVHERHPEVSDADVVAAASSPLDERLRIGTDPVQLAGIGLDTHGNDLEYVGEYYGSYLDVYHAMAATDKMRIELGLI